MGSDMDKVKKKGYSAGYALGATICLCSMVTLIALTIKLVLVLF